MKIIYIECNAEEMRANRSVIECLTEAFSEITRTICGAEEGEETIKNTGEIQDLEKLEEECEA